MCIFLLLICSGDIQLQAMPKRIVNAKIACLDINLQKQKLALGMCGMHVKAPVYAVVDSYGSDDAHDEDWSRAQA